MKHLKQPQINQIRRQMNLGGLSVWRIAKLAGKTPRRIRPSHPQCNGKLEKLNHTISRLYCHFGGDLDKAVRAYSEKKLHMGLDWKTPKEVWMAKIAKGLIYRKASQNTERK